MCIYFINWFSNSFQFKHSQVHWLWALGPQKRKRPVRGIEIQIVKAPTEFHSCGSSNWSIIYHSINIQFYCVIFEFPTQQKAKKAPRRRRRLPVCAFDFRLSWTWWIRQQSVVPLISLPKLEAHWLCVAIHEAEVFPGFQWVGQMGGWTGGGLVRNYTHSQSYLEQKS